MQTSSRLKNTLSARGGAGSESRLVGGSSSRLVQSDRTPSDSGPGFEFVVDLAPYLTAARAELAQEGFAFGATTAQVANAAAAAAADASSDAGILQSELLPALARWEIDALPTVSAPRVVVSCRCVRRYFALFMAAC
jgi:hypothetical protein